MDIKTKYELRQSVFYMNNNQVKESVINQILAEVRYRIGYKRKVYIDMSVSYYLLDSNLLYEEGKLFPTKEELLKSL